MKTHGAGLTWTACENTVHWARLVAECYLCSKVLVPLPRVSVRLTTSKFQLLSLDCMELEGPFSSHRALHVSMRSQVGSPEPTQGPKQQSKGLPAQGSCWGLGYRDRRGLRSSLTS